MLSAGTLSPARWARRAAEHPRRVLAAWGAAVLVSLALVGALLAGALSPAARFTGSPESERAKALITERIGKPEADTEVAVITERRGGRDLRRAAGGLAARVRALGPGYAQAVSTPWSGGAPAAMVSKDGRSALVQIRLPGGYQDQKGRIPALLSAAAAAERASGDRVLLTGEGAIAHDAEISAQKDLQTGEMIGIPVAIVVLLLVFGTLVSALMPVALAIAAIIVAMGLTALLGQFVMLSTFVENMITMMGLAVGIDYALFIVSRYREEIEAGRDRLDAIEAAGASAGRAVLVSGVTVVAALAGLLIVPTSIFFSLAAGAIIVVVSGLAAAMTLLPAAISLLGPRLDAGRLSRLVPARARRGARTSVWARVARAVMRRPAVSAAAVVLVLLAASVPALGLKIGSSGAGVSGLPSSSQARLGFEAMHRGFPAASVAPARIPIVGDPRSAANVASLRDLERAIAGQGVFGTPYLESGASARGGVLDVPVEVDPNSPRATAAVRTLRASTSWPVGGTTSANIDYFDIASGYLPIVVGFVLAMSFLVLLVAFRSLTVPLLAIAMNLLSVGAAYGLLTLVTQDGHGAGLLGLAHVHDVEAWIPLFLFSVLFGLSMDYHVFLLSRIRERWEQGASTEDAIVGGIASSARLITGAALIMVAVFAGFASGHLVMFQQMGFGLGVAILIDATLIRTIMVPATMKLLGERNWWLPRGLDRMLPRVSLEGGPLTPAPQAG